LLDQSPDARSRPLAGVRLLIVEDNVDCSNALKFLLEYNGAEVQAAASADAGRAAFADLRPHVVISDLSMPGEDGFSFLASVRALRPEMGSETPAVAFSAMSPTNARARAREVGFQVFLRKPGDVLLIVPTVVRLLPPAFAP
jgi:DNA-binding response OmpR family regulator